MAIGTPTWSVVSGGGSINSNGLYTPPYAVGTTTVQAAVGAATGTASVTYSGQAEWASATSSSWNTGGNWNTSTGSIIASPCAGGIVGDAVLFALAAGNVARLDGADPNLAAITFNNAATGYTIAQGSGGSLTLQGGVAPAELATVAALAGNHAISRTPLQIASNTVFSAAAASSLTVTGGIDGSGSLTVNGGGRVYLSGSNRYSGGTSVAGGTLIVTTVSALPDGGNIVVGSDRPFSGGRCCSDQQTAAAEIAVTTGSLATSSAILPAASFATRNRFPAMPLDGPSQLQSTTAP